MFQRFHEKLKDREEGFTLIELLVVILIIAILAAIAIPVFLSQREKGWVAQSESALKNAATAYESLATGNNGSYFIGGSAPAVLGATPSLEADEGFNPVVGVTVTIEASTTANSYCLMAVHTQGVADMYYSSETGEPTETAC